MNNRAHQGHRWQVRAHAQSERPRAEQPTGVAPTRSEGEAALIARPRWSRSRLPQRWRGLASDERGAVTAEYALVIVAAVAFAGLLIVIMRSDEVRATLVALVQDALNSGAQ